MEWSLRLNESLVLVLRILQLAIRSTGKRPAQRGFTLLELLLVLAVMAVIAGLSWPRMLRYMQENSIRQNVEVVRRELAATRILAIESGLTYQFRFEPNKQSFIVLPFDRPESVATTDPLATPTKVKTVVGQLSADCHFSPAKDQFGNLQGGQQLDEVWMSLLKNGAQFRDTVWSQPILFRPNGESQDIQLSLLDRLGNQITLKVRGLTGSVTVDHLRRTEVRP